MLDAVSWLKGVKQNAVLIILNQKITEVRQFELAWNACARHVVTDGAADRLRALNNSKYVPDLIVGDFDSINEETKTYYEKLGVKMVRDEDVNRNDFMKAMIQSHEHFEDENFTFYAFNALGGRIDHCWSSYLILTLAEKRGDRLILLSSENVTFKLGTGEHTIYTPKEVLDPFCGYCPVKGEANVTTKGLEWDVEDYHCSFTTRLSTSNLLTAEQVYLKTDKPVFFTLNIKPGL